MINKAAERDVYEIANLISYFRGLILDKINREYSADWENWNEMRKNLLQIMPKENFAVLISQTAIVLGLDESSWELCQALSSELNQKKHGNINALGIKDLIEKLRGSRFEKYQDSLFAILSIYSADMAHKGMK